MARLLLCRAQCCSSLSNKWRHAFSPCEPPQCVLAACEVWLGGQRPFYVDVLSDCRSHASEAYIVGFRKLLDVLSSDPRFSEAWKKAPSPSEGSTRVQ